MQRIEKLELTLKPPRHGWLPFRLALDDIVLEDAASNVLNDPLSSLFDLASHLAGAGRLPSRVCLWLEPSGYALDAEPAGKPGLHILRLFYHHDFVPPMPGQSMTLRHEVSIESSRASRSLTRGLADLLRDAEVDALNTWRTGETVGTYQERLRRLRALARSKHD